MPMGRPSIYSDELAARICEQIAMGMSLRKIAEQEGMPSLFSVFKWLGEKPDFSAQYARAKEEQAELLADEIAEIADTEPVCVVDQNGVSRVDSGWVTWQKNRVDARKWIASKLKPKKYGDKVSQEITGQDGAPLISAINIRFVKASEQDSDGD